MSTSQPTSSGTHEARVFGLRFFALLLAFAVLSWAVSLQARLVGVQIGLAAAASKLAALIGSGSPRDGHLVLVPGLTIDVNFECTGVYVLLLLFAFLLAYPANWEQRLNGILIGVTGLTLINVLRLAFLIRVAELGPGLFDYFHEYVWQGVFLVLVITYAMAWVERIHAADG